MPTPSGRSAGPNVAKAGMGVSGAASAGRVRRSRRAGRTAAGVGLAVALLVLGSTMLSAGSVLPRALRVAAEASPGWAAASLVFMAASFLASGLGLVGASGRRVSLHRTSAVELAGAFCNRLTPAGVGRMVLRVKYLRRAGLSGEAAAAAVAVASVVGGTVHGAGVVVAGLLATSSPGGAPPLPSGRVAGTVAAVVLVLAAAAAAGVSTSRNAAAMCRAWGRRASLMRAEVGRLAGDRAALIRLLAGHVGSTLSFVGAFWAAGRAVGLGLGLAASAFVYLVGTAAANTVPVPGGLGPTEITLSVGLTAAGAAPGLAVAAVLVFRLASFWLPAVAGAVVLGWLCRRGLLGRPLRTAPFAVSVGEVQDVDTFSTASQTQGGIGTTETPSSTSRGESIMRTHISGRLGRLSTVQKVLLFGGTAAVVGGIGTGAAYAAPSGSGPMATQSQETTSSPDTDNVQSGDQTAPETTPDRATAGDAADRGTAIGDAADTDNVQSGDQTGPDTARDRPTAGDTADPGTAIGEAADTDNVQSGD